MKRDDFWVRAGHWGWIKSRFVDEVLNFAEDPEGRDEMTFLYEGEEYTSLIVHGQQPG